MFLGLALRLGMLNGTGFTPSSLFTSGAQGAWYDPSDFSTLFQDAAGTTPVTAVEQPVRLMLDRSKGLVLGSELVNLAAMPTPAISNFGGSVGAWDASTRTMSNTVTGTDTGYPRISFNFSLIIGRTYQVAGRLSGDLTALFPNPSIRLASGGAANSLSYNSTTGVFEGKVVAASNGIEFLLNGTITAPTELTIEELSIRELPGNHALAPNDASRPVLRARYNLVERSEEFDNGYWTKTNGTVTANAGVAPDGTTTADKLIVNNAVNSGRVQRVTTLSAATAYRVSMYAKAAEWGWLAFRVAEDSAHAIWFDISTGVVGANEGTWTDATITALANGWYRCQATYTTVGTSYTFRFLPTNVNAAYSTGNGTSGILIWGAQLLTAADAAATGNAYQRIAAATDYDTSNPVWRPYLAFDGSDDFMSAGDVMDLGTANQTTFSGAAITGANGTVYAKTVFAGGASRYSLLRDTSILTSLFENNAGTSNGTLNPDTTSAQRVISVLLNRSAGTNGLRINGTAVGSVASFTPESANLGTTYRFLIGAYNNSTDTGETLHLNGRLYSLIVLGRTATAAEISAMESWINGKTGAY